MEIENCSYAKSTLGISAAVTQDNSEDQLSQSTSLNCQKLNSFGIKPFTLAVPSSRKLSTLLERAPYSTAPSHIRVCKIYLLLRSCKTWLLLIFQQFRQIFATRPISKGEIFAGSNLCDFSTIRKLKNMNRKGASDSADVFHRCLRVIDCKLTRVPYIIKGALKM